MEAIPMILSRGIQAESRISRYVTALSIDSKLTGYNSALGACVHASLVKLIHLAHAHCARPVNWDAS